MAWRAGALSSHKSRDQHKTSLPGMGVVMTVELIAHIGDIKRFRSADALAAAAGLTPVLRQSGKYDAVRRANSGDKALKRVFFPSAFAALPHSESKTFHDRKPAEGRRHNQAVVALARRRINVIRAIVIPTSPPSKTSKSQLDLSIRLPFVDLPHLRRAPARCEPSAR